MGWSDYDPIQLDKGYEPNPIRYGQVGLVGLVSFFFFPLIYKFINLVINSKTKTLHINNQQTNKTC